MQLRGSGAHTLGQKVYAAVCHYRLSWFIWELAHSQSEHAKKNDSRAGWQVWISDLLFHIRVPFPNRFVQLISTAISHNQLYRGNFHIYNKALDIARRSIAKISSFHMIYPSFHFQAITGNSRNHLSNLLSPIIYTIHIFQQNQVSF